MYKVLPLLDLEGKANGESPLLVKNYVETYVGTFVGDLHKDSNY